MAQRFGSKIALIKEAMDSQPDNTYAIITEIDVRFFGNASAQIADLVDDALERCGPNCDAVFQREDDHSLHRNMGFIVLRVCESVRHLFEAVGLATAAAKGAPTGKQNLNPSTARHGGRPAGWPAGRPGAGRPAGGRRPAGWRPSAGGRPAGWPAGRRNFGLSFEKVAFSVLFPSKL